jgi:carbonic anhydrase
MSVLNEVLAANKAYVADFGAKGSLALPPARSFAILTCMDARLDPAKYAGHLLKWLGLTIEYGNCNLVIFFKNH